MEGNSEDFRALAQEVLEEFGALGRRMGSRMQNARRGEHGVIHALACSASPLTPSELATLGHLSSARDFLAQLGEKDTREMLRILRRVNQTIDGNRAARQATDKQDQERKGGQSHENHQAL